MRRHPLASHRLLALVTALLAAVVTDAGNASAERVRVALLPVLVHSAESGDYLRRGLADMLVARLGRDPRLAVIEVEEAAAATADVAAARATARQAGAAWVVFGSFTRFGEGASLDLQVARVDGDAEPQPAFAHAASLGALIPMLDGVSERISARILGSQAGAATAPAASGADGGEVAELRRRVAALERAVDQLGAARMPAEPKGAPTVQPPGPRPERE